MREDLNKLLCERERRGSKHLRYRRVRRSRKSMDLQFDAEGETPLVTPIESMTTEYGRSYGDRRDFSENLNPLYGAVRKAVNRPWDKFYSELCQNFDMSSRINDHILVHLNQYVEQDVYEKDGELWIKSRWNNDRKLKGSYVEFYVDPRDGILKENKKSQGDIDNERRLAREKKAERDAVFRKLEDGSELHKIDGVWYIMTAAEVPPFKITYVKPEDKDEFTTRRGKRVPWEKLDEWDRKRQGIRKIEGETVRCAVKGTICPGAVAAGTKYFTSKRTASHEFLKKAGVV